MRIIGGQFGGRKLLGPDGDQTRPVTDRVKQSLFDIIAPLIADAEVYDCFSGTGSMGLECLSREAAHITFFEQDRSALARLSQNIMALRTPEKTRTISGDIFKWFERATKRPDDAGKIGADIIFLDPPYRFVRDRPDELIQLAFHMTHMHLRPDGLLIFRHDAADRLELPNLHCFDERVYGSQMLELMRRTNVPEAGPDAASAESMTSTDSAGTQGSGETHATGPEASDAASESASLTDEPGT